MFIKADSQVLDVFFLDDFQQHAEKTVNRIGMDTVRIHRRECVKSSVHQTVSVHQQKRIFHGSSSALSGAFLITDII